MLLVNWRDLRKSTKLLGILTNPMNVAAYLYLTEGDFYHAVLQLCLTALFSTKLCFGSILGKTCQVQYTISFHSIDAIFTSHTGDKQLG